MSLPSLLCHPGFLLLCLNVSSHKDPGLLHEESPLLPFDLLWTTGLCSDPTATEGTAHSQGSGLQDIVSRTAQPSRAPGGFPLPTCAGRVGWISGESWVTLTVLPFVARSCFLASRTTCSLTLPLWQGVPAGQAFPARGHPEPCFPGRETHSELGRAAPPAPLRAASLAAAEGCLLTCSWLGPRRGRELARGSLVVCRLLLQVCDSSLGITRGLAQSSK